MHKLPRDLSGKKLAKLLKKYDYKIDRKTGSHFRLISHYKNIKHKITIPDHNSIKIGTLNNILNDLSEYLELTKEDLIRSLFG